MAASPEETARELLEVTPLVLKEIRAEMRRQTSVELGVPQFRSLNFVDKNQGASLLDVANHLGLTPPSTSRLVDGLLARGLLTRQDHPSDRRRVSLTVTAKGQRILEASRKGTLTYLAAKLEGVEPNDRESIVRAMKMLQPIFANNGKPSGAK